MTTVATQRPTLDVRGTAPVPFITLVRVEARKMLDTRAGLWLMFVTGVLILLTMVATLLVVLANDIALTANGLSQVLVIPLSLLIPVFAILTVTSEWGQRTGLVTFTLEPNRFRVFLAKWVTVSLLALGTIAAAAILGAVGNLLYGAMSGNEVVWNLDLTAFVWIVASQLLYFWMAFGLSTLLLSTPASIVIFYIVALLLPLMVYSWVYSIFDWGRALIPWIDMNYALAPFLDPGESAEAMDLVRVLVTVMFWVVTPTVLGMLRINRSEPK